ncbi:MAG TPA: class I SAM-dependent methyltransferase [Candidatus Eisenbacteria bacterium]|nr:class I SAM-dependent methyltransferase [Candidatus Eisenbacteria bacterium]
MPLDDSDVQDRITTFWNTIARYYDSDPGNVPSLESAEYEAWIRAIKRFLPPQPADVLDIGTGTGFVALIASQLGHRVTGLDLSTAMLAEARMQADRRGLKASFRIGDAVAPPIDEVSLDAIVCRHFLWTLREPEVALGNWRRLLRPNGRVVVIDAFLANLTDQSAPEEGADLFERCYTDRTREALPAMRWERVEPVADLLIGAGFSEVTVSDLADIHKLAEKPAFTQPWYVATARRG